MFQRLHARVRVRIRVPFRNDFTRRTNFAGFSPRSKRKAPLPPSSLFLFVSPSRVLLLSVHASVQARVCGRFRRICNILFCVENGLEGDGTAMRACPLNRMSYSPFPVYRRFLPCNRKPFPAYTALDLTLTRPSLRSPRFWQVAGLLAKTTCLSILPVALLRVIKVSPFSFPFLSSYIPLSHPPFVPLFPHVASASIHLVG